VIADVHRRTGRLVDPHTAVGIGVAESTMAAGAAPMVCLATAHPAKFPDAVEQATGIRPPLPDRLAGLFDRPERFETLHAVDVGALRAYVTAAVGG
jgi:threonine synthase